MSHVSLPLNTNSAHTSLRVNKQELLGNYGSMFLLPSMRKLGERERDLKELVHLLSRKLYGFSSNNKNKHYVTQILLPVDLRKESMI